MLWRGKVLAQVVKSTWFVWEDLGSSPIYAIFMCIKLVLFLCILNMLWSFIIIELYWLVWNMNLVEWFGIEWQWHKSGFKP